MSLKHHVAAQETTLKGATKHPSTKAFSTTPATGIGKFLLGHYCPSFILLLWLGWFLSPKNLPTAAPSYWSWFSLQPVRPTPESLFHSHAQQIDLVLSPSSSSSLQPCTLLWVLLLGKGYFFRKVKAMFSWDTCLTKQSIYQYLSSFFFFF